MKIRFFAILAAMVLTTPAFASSYVFYTSVLGLRASSGAPDNAVSPPANCTPGTATFAYTGAAQAFTVPAGCSQMSVVAWGAGGGSSSVSGGNGGAGAYAAGTFSVTGGQQYTIVVGRGGFIGSPSAQGAVYGGGGTGGGGYAQFYAFAGSGGGGSFVQFNGADLLVAAGGGGGGWWGGQSGSSISYFTQLGNDARVASSTGNVSTSDAGTSSSASGGGGGGHNGGAAGNFTGGPSYAYANGGYGGVSYIYPSATGSSSVAGSNGTAPMTSSSDYAAGIGGGGKNLSVGGNGRVVIHYQ